MKNIFYTLLLVFIYSCSNAQIVIDMAGDPVNGETKNGQYYIKDINNFMLPYLGTWRYVNENKEFRITLTKVSQFHVFIADANINYYKDGLIIQYQEFENGQLIFSSPTETYATGIIKEFGKLNMSFTDYQRNEEIFPVDLILIPNGNGQYNLKFRLDKFERRNTYYQQHPNEPYFSVPNDIIMTKM
ncbi:hypothetical protein GV828_01395 [Flavobacterium sp. NST-5]|uniref:DUF6705 domain-containing protein n=1 Tax=Flavobacterium ichthyis TaxID=2698827 RepID=A0ABW9Z4T6_9FLAO|nr:DUF6705 family protein [Flavobacterium ichthyis]NBL63848.1 hypothetical protein [Flavobacterium ichthyis]